MAGNVRMTTKPTIITLSSARKDRLDKLMDGWCFEDKKFIKGMLKLRFDEYRNSSSMQRLRGRFFDFADKAGKFSVLGNMAELRNWQKRYEMTGERNARKAMAKIIKKELTFNDIAYILHQLEKETEDVIIPDELADLVYKIYVAHLRKEAISGKDVPKRPFILVVGPTGAGKTHTIKGAVKKAIFTSTLKIRRDFREEKESLAAAHPVIMNIPFLSWFKLPAGMEELEKEEDLAKTLDWYRRLGKVRGLKRYARKRVAALEKRLGHLDREYEEMEIDYRTISPHDIQTMWYGETGNKFKAAMGEAGKPSIRHILEAHGVLSDPKRSREDDVQARTLSATVNKIMDEIADGERECILIADTHSPEEIASDTYRRFDEMGAVIDVSQYWRNKKYLRQLVELELKQHDFNVGQEMSEVIADHILAIFNAKGLPVTPAYVRKLIASLLEQKGSIRPEYFGNENLIRQCFRNVAMNSYGDLYKKVVKRPRSDDGCGWDDYQGSVKNDFLEMITSTLFYQGQIKGAVLIGPPGSGKTFLTRVIAATYPDISYLSAGLDDLYEEGAGIQGIIKNIDSIYSIGKMLAPSMIVINEADAVVKKRNTHNPDVYDRVTNKFLDILDGDESVRGTFTVLTTNLFENLDPAIVRPGRLEAVMVEGRLSEKDIYRIIERELGDEPRDENLTLRDIYTAAKSINDIPAGYVDFVRKIKDLRRVEYRLIEDFKGLYLRAQNGQANQDDLANFIKFNIRVVTRVIEALCPDTAMVIKAKKDIKFLLQNNEWLYLLMAPVNEEGYRLRSSHLANAKIDLLKNPQKKSIKGLNEFLSEELSIEPQVGKIVGAAYGNNMGFLVPINTNLVFAKAGANPISITGVTKASALQQVDYSEMTLQSAEEGLTLNIHYWQNLLSEDEHLKNIDAAGIVGRIMRKHSIHHQMESVNYMGGGPSAGFALAINTLSVLLNLPVYHDFGITGAPGTRGVSRDKAGSSVMIGGEDKKTERVLMDLRRMYVPKKNISSISPEHQEAYWREDKIVLPVSDYRDLIPEVIFFGPDSDRKLRDLIDMRLQYNRKITAVAEEECREEEQRIMELETALREQAEFEIKRRLVALFNYFRNSRRDEFSSLEYIFSEYDPLK